MPDLTNRDEVQKQPPFEGLFLPPLLQLLLSGSGLLITGLFGLLVFMAGVMGLLQGSKSSELLPLFSLGWSAALICALFVPSVVSSSRKLSGKESPRSPKRRFRLSLVGLVLWGGALLLGHFLSTQDILPWLFLPPLQLIAVLAPIFFLIELGRRKLPHIAGGDWSVYSFGVMLTQPLVLMAEMILVLLVAAFVLVWASAQPELMDSLVQLAQRLRDAQFDPQLMEQIITPFLQRPAVIYIGLTLGAGLIPLLEELLKPLAVWVMLGRRFHESEGFVLGLFAGGTFALLESLGMAASAVQSDWSAVMLARVGTAILHVTSTALVGWGLGAAWQKRKYFQLGVVFFLAFLLHSIWNAFGLLLGFVPFVTFSGIVSSLNLTGPIALVILALVMVLILIGANRYFQQTNAEEENAEGVGSGPNFNGSEIDLSETVENSKT